MLQGPAGEKSESITNVVVEASSLELDDPQQNKELLQRLAATTGGKYLLWSEALKLPSLIKDRHQDVETRVEHELWTAPLPLVIFTMLLVGEWLLRKRTGLL